jgi:hypothetical protein
MKRLSVDWGFIAVLFMVLTWFYPRPADLLVALSRAREVVVSLLPDTPAASAAYASTAPRCAGASQSNAVRVFDDMNVNTCDSGLRVVLMNTSLTPGTGELRLSLANTTHANGSTSGSIQ